MFKVSCDPKAALVVLTPCRKVYLGHGAVRLHHGLVGELCLAAGCLLHKKTPIAIGAALMLHDRHDFPFPIHDPEGWGPKAIEKGPHS